MHKQSGSMHFSLNIKKQSTANTYETINEIVYLSQVGVASVGSATSVWISTKSAASNLIKICRNIFLY